MSAAWVGGRGSCKVRSSNEQIWTGIQSWPLDATSGGWGWGTTHSEQGWETVRGDRRWDDSMNIGKNSQLGMHGFGSLHNLTWPCYQNEASWFDTDFVSSMKLTTFPLIHSFDVYKMGAVQWGPSWVIVTSGTTENITLLQLRCRAATTKWIRFNWLELDCFLPTVRVSSKGCRNEHIYSRPIHGDMSSAKMSAHY